MNRRPAPCRFVAARLVPLLAVCLLLVGCATIWDIPAPEPQPSREVEPVEAPSRVEPAPEPACPQLPVEELETEAMALLDQGRTEEARLRLDCALERDPQAPRAALLVEQLDADPVAYLGRQSFAYTVQPGESLSRLARRYLGNPLKFIALARYNDIAVPADLRVGQRIRIPGKAPPPPKPKPQEPDAGALLQRALDAEADGELERALELARRAAAAQDAPEQAREVSDRIEAVLVRRYSDQAYDAEARENLALAMALWQQVLELDPENFEAQLNRNRLQDQVQ